MAVSRAKITIVGAGSTGSTAALMIAQSNLGDIVLIDPPAPGLSKGRALDIYEASPIQGFTSKIIGTDDYKATAGSSVVVITAGVPRKPGMGRDDLASTNASIIESVTKETIRYSPEATIVVLSNPVDVMTYICYKASGLPRNRVVGQSGALDTGRFRAFVADKLGVSVNDITGIVIGEHGNGMIPLVRFSSAGGIPLTQLLSDEDLQAIVERTKFGGAEIVDYLKTGSAYYAPAAALEKMVRAILCNEHTIIPSTVVLDGEYGYKNVCLGVPVVLGNQGIESIIELKLNSEEQSMLDESATAVRKAMESLMQTKQLI